MWDKKNIKSLRYMKLYRFALRACLLNPLPFDLKVKSILSVAQTPKSHHFKWIGIHPELPDMVIDMGRPIWIRVHLAFWHIIS